MKKILIAMLFLITGKMFAVTPVVLNISTGWNQTLGSPLSPGAPDPEWQILLNGTGSPITPTVGYPAPSASCASIQPGPYGNDVIKGFHVYRYTFVNNYCDLTPTAFISFNFTNADDAIINFSVNSTFTYDYLSNSPYILPGIMTGFPAYSSYGINFPSSNIHAGINYIDFLVYNDTADIYDSPNYLAIQASLVYYHNGTQYMTPSFTMPSSICQSSLPLTVDGTGSTGTINDHVWLVVESDASGNPVASATEWWGPFVSGSPGLYTIPSVANGGPDMMCGKYYRVKLATQNACSPWAETTHVIYIACSATADMGPDQCASSSGGCVTFTAGVPRHGYLYSWIQQTHHGNISLGNSASITVCPTVTTTYCVTTTNTSNGCSSTDCATVYVEQNNPDFTWTCDNSNPNYAQITATPVQTTSLPSGFQYLWKVEEMAGTTPVFTDLNPSCWWNFPTVVSNNFNGLFGIASPPYQDGTCPSTPGQFKYFTQYRITRGVWSEHCPYYEISKLVSCGTAPTREFVINSTPGLNTNTEFKIYPNPTNGQLNIEYTIPQNGKINITDVTGQVLTILNVSSAENRKNIDLSAYTDGIYFVHLYAGDQLFKTEKVVISH